MPSGKDISGIRARLARGECANFVKGKCQNKSECTLIDSDKCNYFENYVMPLLESEVIAEKYHREAKMNAKQQKLKIKKPLPKPVKPHVPKMPKVKQIEDAGQLILLELVPPNEKKK